MMPTITLSFILSLSMTSTMSSSPLTMGVTLLLSMTTLMMFLLFSLPSWLTMILFIIYIGGMMVLLSYFLSMEPNIKLSSMSMIATFLLMLSMTTTNWNPNWSHYQIPLKMEEISNIMLNSELLLLMLLTTSLFYILIIIVSLTNKPLGPMRPFLQA